MGDVTTSPIGAIDRRDAIAFDASDPLAAFRDRFFIGDSSRIYLDGNSLGRLPLTTVDRLRAAIGDWGSDLVEGWNDWIDLPVRIGDRLAGACLGARPGQVLACDSTTVNLFKLAHAVLDIREGAVVTDAANFPTDRYVLEGVARSRGRAYVAATSVEEALDVERPALLCLSHVDYRSGELLDMRSLTRRASAPVLWDVSHSVGAVAIDLSDAELAVGCTYKYLNAGPGAPAFLYVRSDLQRSLRSPIQGWFGQREQFVMGAHYEPADGIERFLAGTPPILGLVALDESLSIFEEAGMAAIAAKGAALGELVIGLHDAWLAPLGFELASPRDPGRRGSHVALRHADAWPICRAMIELRGVTPDFRRPDIVRLGLPALYTRFVDVWDAMDRVRTLVEREEHRGVDARLRRVT